MAAVPNYITIINDLFANGDLAPRSPIQLVPRIGPHYQARLNGAGIYTIAQFVRSFHNLTLQQIRDRLTRLLQNPHANQCIEVSKTAAFKSLQPAPMERKGRKRVALKEPKYMVRDVNFRSFLALRALLIYARNNPAIWGRLRGGGNLVLGNIPAFPPTRGPEAALCPCFKSQQTCDRYSQSCLWIPKPGVKSNRRATVGNCNPLNENVGFEGVANYRPQLEIVAKPARPGTHYIGGWRKAQPIPPL